VSSSKNDITGDSIITKISSAEYRNNFDLIFRKSMIKFDLQQLENENEIQKTCIIDTSDTSSN